MRREDKHHPPSLGREPTGETEERKNVFNLERNSLQAELKTINMTSEEVTRAAKDREGWKLMVRALYFPEGMTRNKEEEEHL